jgi:hypothetical protein
LARSIPAKGVQLWIVPEMNPDGTAADARQNAHGVDLNRNFPYQWQKVTDPVYYSGPRPLSEPETRAAVKLIRRIRPAVTIWYHQHEDLVDMAGGDRGVARGYAHLAHLRATCLPFLPGTATGWSNHEFPGTTSFVVEVPAGPVGSAALAAHLRAVRAMELGQRVDHEDLALGVVGTADDRGDRAAPDRVTDHDRPRRGCGDPGKHQRQEHSRPHPRKGPPHRSSIRRIGSARRASARSPVIRSRYV